MTSSVSAKETRARLWERFGTLPAALRTGVVDQAINGLHCGDSEREAEASSQLVSLCADRPVDVVLIFAEPSPGGIFILYDTSSLDQSLVIVPVPDRITSYIFSPCIQEIFRPLSSSRPPPRDRLLDLLFSQRGPTTSSWLPFRGKAAAVAATVLRTIGSDAAIRARQYVAKWFDSARTNYMP